MFDSSVKKRTFARKSAEAAHARPLMQASWLSLNRSFGKVFRQIIAMKAVKYIYIIGVLVVLAIAGCGRGTGEKGLTHDEVVAINERVLEKAISQPDRALMMIERLRAGDFSVIDTTGASLQWRGPLPDHFCDYFRAKVYSQTLEGEWLDSAIIIGERLMTTDAAREDLAYRQNLLEMLINACRQHRDDEQAIRWSAELIGLYHENGDETEALRTEADMGLMLSGIGHADEGLAKIDSVLTLLSDKRKFNELDATIIALKRKVNVLKTRGEGQEVRGERIVECAQQMLDLMADYEQHADEFHDGTYREPPEHLRPVYIDFYRAQAYMYMTEAHASMSPKLGSLARKYLSLFEQTDYAKTYMARKDFAPTYGLLGEYDKMLAIHDEQEVRLRQQGDTMCVEFATILRDRAMAAEMLGRHAEANRLHHAYETLTATLNDHLLEGKAHLYAARFHAAEQQREIERGRVRANRAAMVATAVGIIALLVLILAGYALRQRRRTERKNRVLVERIDAALEYKKMYEEVLQRQKPRLTIQTPPTPLDTDPATLDDAELFNFLSDVIIRERLYLNPLFERQVLADCFHVSNQRIAAAFAHGRSQSPGTDVDDSGRKALPDFISTQRLEYACVLLSERPDMSIDEVATASGFSSYPAFARSFKKKYDVTPTEYRRCHPIDE